MAFRPRPPPAGEVRRIYKACPHTGLLRVALHRDAPGGGEAASSDAEAEPFAAALRQLHAVKSNGRVQQGLPRHPPAPEPAPELAAAADAGASSPAPRRPSSQTGRGGGKTVAESERRGAALLAAAQLAADVTSNVVGDFRKSAELAEGEQRISTGSGSRFAHHDEHGYRSLARRGLIERVHTPGRVLTPGRTVRTPGAPAAQQVATPPAEWGFSSGGSLGALGQATTERAATAGSAAAARQRWARRRQALEAKLAPRSPAPQPATDRGPRRPPAAAPDERLSLTCREWASTSTPPVQRRPDPFVRAYPFAGDKPSRPTENYPPVPNHYHLAFPRAGDDNVDDDDDGWESPRVAEFRSAPRDKLTGEAARGRDVCRHIAHVTLAPPVPAAQRSPSRSRGSGELPPEKVGAAWWSAAGESLPRLSTLDRGSLSRTRAEDGLLGFGMVGGGVSGRVLVSAGVMQ